MNKAANVALIKHLESGGVKNLMYGGNANFYHAPLAEYAGLLDFLAESVGADTWVLPSVGPDYGKMMEQAKLIKVGKYNEAEAVRARYMPLEDCRDGTSPIRVLDDAVTLAGIAAMGPMLPMLTGLEPSERARVEPTSR